MTCYRLIGNIIVRSVLLRLTETWKQALGNNLCIGAVMADLSRAFDSMPHKLLTSKRLIPKRKYKYTVLE